MTVKLDSYIGACRLQRGMAAVLSGLAIMVVLTVSGMAQSLNWEGQTGAFITPFAYTSASPAKGVGHPNLSFHYLNTGSVIGNNFQASVTLGFLSKIEIGYTRSMVSAANSTLSPLFKNGFNVVHGKVNFVPENYGKKKWVPALAVGFVARTQVQRVGGAIKLKDTTNGDVYVVATKVVTNIPKVPVLLNVGVKATNASLYGIAGNATQWEGRAFGAVAFVFTAPSKSQFIIGSEVSQQPHYIQDLAGATMPSTFTYFVRVVPKPEKPFNIDFGIAQAAGKIAPGVDVKARAQFAMGISYRF